MYCFSSDIPEFSPYVDGYGLHMATWCTKLPNALEPIFYIMNNIKCDYASTIVDKDNVYKSVNKMDFVCTFLMLTIWYKQKKYCYLCHA